MPARLSKKNYKMVLKIAKKAHALYNVKGLLDQILNF